jgi:hypothetical protein
MRRLRSCVGILVVGWLIYATAMHFVVWYLARKTASDDYQKLSIAPTPLKDMTVERLSGPRIERFGFSFQVPWNEMLTNHSGKDAASLGFEGGAAVLLFDPASAVDGAKIERGTTDKDHALMNLVLGTKALSSNYDLMAAAVQATPNDVKWWASRVHNTGSLLLLENKNMDLVDVNSIHPVTAGAVRGFQFGDPDTAPYVVSLKLFDSSDRQYWILITGMHVHHSVITQGAINALIASLQPVAARPVERSSHNGF